MKTLKNKIAALTISILFILSMAAAATASAHTPPWKITTYAYLSTVPHTVGLGQSLFIVMWTYIKMPDSLITNSIRMEDYMLNITTPSGAVKTLGPFVPDPTETTYTTYTPPVVGNYSIVFYYPTTTYIWTSSNSSTVPGASIWTGDQFLGATSKIVDFTVQQAPVPAEPSSEPLPTSYWTYPIYAMNYNWYTISSNWLGSGSPQIGTEQVQPDGTGPTSAHILWTMPIQAGGIVGGTDVGIDGNDFYTGQSYNQRFADPIILEGILYFRLPAFTSSALDTDTANAGNTEAVNLRTGQVIWTSSTMPTLSFAMTYDFETANQEGVLYNGILFTANFAQAFDPLTGKSMFNVTGVPSGTQVLGPAGEIYRYVFQNKGTTAKPNYYMLEWNSDNLWTTPSFYPALLSPVNGDAPSMFDWNVSVPWYNQVEAYESTVTPTQLNGATSGVGTVVALNANTAITNPYTGAFTTGPDVLMGVNGTTSLLDPNYTIFGGVNGGTANPYTIWAVSTSNSTPGQLLWMKTYTAPSGDPDVGVIIWPETIDWQTGVFNMYETDTEAIWGYSIATGAQLWGPDTIPNAFNVFMGSVNTENTGSHHVAYGNLYVSGYGGIVYCYNDTTGAREWNYGNGGAGNNTVTLLNLPWGNYPTFIAAIADGMLYCFNDEHSPSTPLYPNYQTICLNATTGQQIWTLNSFDDGGSFVGTAGAVADGEWVYDNMYNMELYAIGQGPTSTTVEAPQTVVTAGTPVVIQGTVMDISAGTTQNQQAMDFPHGVPCASEASMTAWMAYVYDQQPEPTNFTGVTVTLTAIDPNHNFITLGQATTTDTGLYTLTWTPPAVPGNYLITATFSGSNGYYGSNAQTGMVIQNAPAAPAPTASPPTGLASTTTVEYGVVAIVIVIVVIGIVLAMLLMRKRP